MFIINLIIIVGVIWFFFNYDVKITKKVYTKTTHKSEEPKAEVVEE